MPYICRENLEKEVDDAIKKGCSIKFDKRPIEECRYMQKYAEIYISLYGILLTLATFAFAIGVTYIVLYVQDNLSIQGNIQYNRMLPVGIIGFILLLFGIRLIYASPTLLAKKNIKSCLGIILKAEERIIILDAEERRKILDALSKRNKSEETGIQT